MGWWTLRKDNKEVYNACNHLPALDDSELLTVGDQPMDVIISALKKVSQLYKKDLKRRPTTDELTAILESCIRIHEEDLFDDMEERELASVSISLRQRAKRPRPKPGDFFAIPLPSGGYGYGRIMKITLRVILWMELLNIHSADLLSLEDMKKNKVVINLKSSTDKIKSGEWPLIGYIPFSDIDKVALTNEPHWITNYCVRSIEVIAEWKLSGKRGLPPNLYPPYVGYNNR